jgi:hypothetical protein
LKPICAISHVERWFGGTSCRMSGVTNRTLGRRSYVFANQSGDAVRLTDAIDRHAARRYALLRDDASVPRSDRLLHLASERKKQCASRRRRSVDNKSARCALSKTNHKNSE